MAVFPLAGEVAASRGSCASSALRGCRSPSSPEGASVPPPFGGRRKPAQACFYLENAELSGKFDEEGCSCINVLLPGDLNAVSEQCRRSRDQGENVECAGKQLC